MEPSSHSMSTIPFPYLEELIAKIGDSVSNLEIKRTAAAKIGRTEIPDLKFYPKPILPGTMQEFDVRIDRNNKFYFSSNLRGKSPSSYIGPDEVSKKRKIKVSYEQKDAKQIIYSIWLSQIYLQGLSARLKHQSAVEKGEDKHILVPTALDEMISLIEDLFENNNAALADLEAATEVLEKWISPRLKSFSVKMVTLLGYLDVRKEPEKTEDANPKLPESVDKDKSPENIEKIILANPDWEDRTERRFYLGTHNNDEFNKDNLFDAIDNLLNDILFPTEKWVLDSSESDTTFPVPNLELRVQSEDDAYKSVEEKIGPVEEALRKEEDNPDKAEGYKSAIKLCKEIKTICSSKHSPERSIKNPAARLDSEINQIIRENGLEQLMKEVIETYFPGYYQNLIDEEKLENLQDIEKEFLKMNRLKSDFDQAMKTYKLARQTIQEHSVTPDTGHVVEEAEPKISTGEGKIREVMGTGVKFIDLEKKAKQLQFSAKDFYDQLLHDLSSNVTNESVFWIGLGQAGGQILRECILYCLNNLSDARCRGLMTALGASSKDLQDIRGEFKNIYSLDNDKKTSAEELLKEKFHKKIHLLAINLGEEVDELAKSSEPAYYVWGDRDREDRSSQTTRTRRNILKLKPKGEGAGGETGVGRAYGFRFETEITEVMRDVGKKGRSNPRHIVITHSLAGGSGSGMVLPVLQQARKTFGKETTIWVVSVGEGASESKSVAKINTPFIVSDILQATYDGIHAVEDPIELSDMRLFGGEITRNTKEMEKQSRELLKLVNQEAGEEILPALSKVFKQGHKGRYLTTSDEWRASLGNLIDFSDDNKDTVKLDGVIATWRGKKVSEIPYKVLISEMLNILPKDKDKVNTFSTWCKEQSTDGRCPATIFWTNWWNSIYDPFSMILDGRATTHKMAQDEAKSDDKDDYYVSSLTGKHLVDLMTKLYAEFKIEDERGKIPEIVSVFSPGLTPLYELIKNQLQNKKKEEIEAVLSKFRTILRTYGLALDSFNECINEITLKILALSGSTNDKLVKSVLVSNAHLELGVNSTNNLVASGKSFTVYNSVIFDLMLNIIGPRLPAEKGVYKVMNEKIDHSDLVKITPSPLVIGLLNHRDSVSLQEAAEARDIAKIEPDEIQRVLKAMLTSKFVNPESSNPVANPMYFDRNVTSNPEMWIGSFFGSRLRYMLQINPYNVVEDASNFTDVDKYCNNLTDLWNDKNSETIFEVNASSRENLQRLHGFSGTHISNLVRWISLIDKSVFFNSVMKDYDRLSELNKETEDIWDLQAKNSHSESQYDIGLLRVDTSVSRYQYKDSSFNTEHLYKTLPKLGIHNAEILRSIGPAYLNSFLPGAILKSIDLGDLNLEELLNYKNFNLSQDSFKEKVVRNSKNLKIEDINGFAKLILELLQSNHSGELSGEIIDPQGSLKLLTVNWKNEFDCILDYFDLQLVNQGESFYLRNHPRLARYFSVVRDVPVNSGEDLLPARSAAASLARYIRSDSKDTPLDPDYIPKNRNGIASPTFSFGNHILNNMRYMNLLPDEKSISFVPLMRILLLGTGNVDKLRVNLGGQLNLLGFNLGKYSETISQIFNEKYERNEILDRPELYAGQLATLITRLHKIKPLLQELKNDFPAGWNKLDLKCLEYFEEEILGNEYLSHNGDLESMKQVLGNDSLSTPEVRGWIQVVMKLVISNHSSEETEGESTDESTEEATDESTEEEEVEETVSNEITTIIRLKQLFYDIAYYLNESIGQAEYLSDEFQKSRSVHFEMTGFSDRLIGKPVKMLTLIHDRNPKLPLDTVSKNTRNAVSYNFGIDLGQAKEFGTSSDFGPTSFATIILGGSPAADISDQFQMLLHDVETGLTGDNPYWSFNQSKLHPYIFLYNILWLSCNVNKWTDAGNKEFIRRLQIPTKTITTHFSNPKRLGQDAIKFESEKTSFSDGVKIPKRDKMDYSDALRGDITGNRNIVKLLGIMALRYELSAGKENLWKGTGIDKSQYKVLKDTHNSEAEAIQGDALFKEVVVKQKAVSNPFMLVEDDDSEQNEEEDNMETRAKAWFEAYSSWLNYAKDNPKETKEVPRTDDAALFTVGDGDSETEESLEQVEE